MQRLSLALPHRLPRVSVRRGRSCVLARVCSSVSVQESEEAIMDRKRRLAAGESSSKQKKVLSLRKSNARSARSICYIQIMGTGMDTGDTSPSVLLFFDSKRFVFNAGEGLQRFCQENRIKISKIDHLLLTRVCSETSGGLAGTLLTLAGGDVGLTIHIWGPSDLQYLSTAMSTYLPNASVFYTHAFGQDGKLKQEDGNVPSIAVLFEDELVKISAVLLVPSLQEDDDEYKGRNCKPGDVAVVYVCELPDVKGRFDPEKAAALGLRPGRKYAELQNGCSVLSDDGKKEIFPNEVMEPSSPGPVFILVDCPTAAHIPSLLAASGLRMFYKREGGSHVACVVHMGPAMVVNDMKYREWMECFGSTAHILAGCGCSHSASPILRSSAKILTKLNFACPYAFPVPGFALKAEDNQTLLQQVSGSSITAAKNLMKFRLLPLSGLGVEEPTVLEEISGKTCEEEIAEKLPEVLPVAEKVREIWKSYDCSVSGKLVEEPFLDVEGSTSNSSLNSSVNLSDVPEVLKGMSRRQVELVFLGTGSSHPSTYRNVSAIYLHFFKNGGMLLDCGEGTYGQLIRRFGAAGAEEVVSRLQCVWISHIHADHHGGLARILSVRRKLHAKLNLNEQEPLLVVGPKLLKRVLEAYEKVEDMDVEFLDCSQTTFEAAEVATAGNQTRGLISSSMESASEGQGHQMQNVWIQRGYHLRNGLDESGRSRLQTVLRAMGVASLVSVPVIHCPHAFGVVIEAERGWKLAYSGDTRPCQAFTEASRGATVFIHEATFEDGMIEEAMSKMHSSTQEAIQAGALAEAYRIILTHFSQRYSKVPVFSESYNDRTCVAFDLMSIDFIDLPLLPTLVPVLKLLFKDDHPEEEVDECPQYQLQE